MSTALDRQLRVDEPCADNAALLARLIASYGLTPMEAHTTVLLLRGLTTVADIAAYEEIAPGTVKRRLNALRRKTGTVSLAQVIARLWPLYQASKEA